MGKEAARKAVQSCYFDTVFFVLTMPIGDGEWRDDSPVYRDLTVVDQHSLMRIVYDSGGVGDEFPWLFSIQLFETHSGTNFNACVSQF